MVTHKFTYQNGIIQQKVLIRHSDYLKVNSLPETTDEEIEIKEAEMFKLTGGKEWFTDKSPLFDAIKTGVLNCNGQYPVKVVDLKKENAYLLQRIDCNCNDCGFLFRWLEKQNIVLANDKVAQQDSFDLVKKRKIERTKKDIANLEDNEDLIRDAAEKIKRKKKYLKELEAAKHSYQGQQTPIQYGVCCKFGKPVTFIPSQTQIETQKCFIHRKDFKIN